VAHVVDTELISNNLVIHWIVSPGAREGTDSLQFDVRSFVDVEGPEGIGFILQ